MLGTYACFAAILVAASLLGQAVIILAGRRRWSSLAPAVGLAALCPLAWWAVRMPGEATTAVVALTLAVAVAGAFVATRASGFADVARAGAPVTLAGLALASLPFLVEWRFGILGTGLNPDMSQHLFAVDRLASGGSERLVADGYPLGPHSVVAALTALGPSAVEAFNGLILATAACACLTPLALLGEVGAGRRIAAALGVGFAYLVAAYLVQGAFKETLEALFVLGFAIGLGELAAGSGEAGRPRALRALAPAVLAIGSVYVYSFPGLLWLGGAATLWAAVELAQAWRQSGPAPALGLARHAAPAALAALGLVALGIAPELGRLVDFAGFETFDPAGAGLGNLFDRLSPLEALGIWPSGDFRVEPGDGAIPAPVFYLGATVAAAALAHGVVWWWRRGEPAIPAALGVGALLWLYALVAGTPYQEAKALVVIAPLVLLVSARAIAVRAPGPVETRRILRRRSIAYLFPSRAREAKARLVIGALGLAFVLGAAASSVLVLVNGPVGPRGYSPALAELRGELPNGSILVRAPRRLLAEQHGADYLAWELRGHRICIEAGRTPAPPGRFAAIVDVALDAEGAVVPAAVTTAGGSGAGGPCPLIADSARADPGG